MFETEKPCVHNLIKTDLAAPEYIYKIYEVWQCVCVFQRCTYVIKQQTPFKKLLF